MISASLPYDPEPSPPPSSPRSARSSESGSCNDERSATDRVYNCYKPNVDDDAPSRPSRADLQHWATALDTSECDVDTLIDLLAEVRRETRDLGWLADYLLLRARDDGASLPRLATAWSRSGNALLVRGPDARLKRLTDEHGTPEALLQQFLSLPSPEHPHANPRTDG